MRAVPVASLVPILAAVLLAARGATAQQLADVVIEREPVRGAVSVLFGRGGNIALSVGADGAFLVDDQFAPLSERILAAVAEATDEPVRFVVNTHWHGDHTGGNANLRAAGAILVAHDNVRERMSADQLTEALGRSAPAAPEAARPVVTFRDAVTFHWNGEAIDVFHVPHAHTDGDAIVHFRGSKVVHMGDTFFNGMYPFIDDSSGGSIHGMIDAGRAVLARIDDETRIIPGHGPVGGPDELRAFVAMLETVRGRLEPLVQGGRTREEAVAEHVTADLDAQWGGGFLEPDEWVGIVYEGMLRRPRGG